MPDIIPNYHPILVHFTIALLSISVLFYLLRLFLPVNHRWREQWLAMANWSLWTGSVITIFTVIAGWYAYNTVAHDQASHAAMTLHRNWAIPSAILFLVLALSSIHLARQRTLPGFKFISVSVCGLVLLMLTGWLGGEAVYRYGLGVMSLPTVEAGADGHNHSHGETSSSSHDGLGVEADTMQELTTDGHEHGSEGHGEQAESMQKEVETEAHAHGDEGHGEQAETTNDNHGQHSH